MAETSKATEKKLEKLGRAVNRRKQALQKLKAGSSSALSERRTRKLVKRAQRRSRKLLPAQTAPEAPAS